MASTKKPGFMVETKPVTERKRRKSELVVMWQLFWDVAMVILMEMWTILLRTFEISKIFFCSEEIWDVQKWLGKYLSRVPDDFSESWRDGILLGKLLNKLQPGCFPDSDKLDINFALNNLSRAFHILEARFDITPAITVEEVATCKRGSDSKLLNLLLQIKHKTEDRENGDKPTKELNEVREDKSNESANSQNCIVKGTGLMVGFVQRTASFVVFFASMSDLDLVVEIKGPFDSMCCERITKRSPKKKKTIKRWKPNSHYNFVRSSSHQENVTSAIINNEENETEIENACIPLEYEIRSNQINFSFVPLVKGDHRISVLSHGQHVSDSPYKVRVESTISTNNNAVPMKPALKLPIISREKEEEQIKKPAVTFQEPSERKESLGKIIKRRVLRYIVNVDGKDIVVDTDTIDNLAPSLLKMDYDFQKRPLIRRNSWGFVGDAERKISAIRQFCVDLDELETQSIKLHRSHSLTFSSKPKNSTRSTSYECEDILPQTRLETVTEGTVSNFKRSSVADEGCDEVFAYLNEEFDSHSVEKVKYTEEHENAESNEVEDAKEVLIRKHAVTVLDQPFITGHNETSFNFESTETPEKDETPADHLTSASESSFRFEAQSDGNFEASSEETNRVSPKFLGTRQIIEISTNKCSTLDKNQGESNIYERKKIFTFSDSSLQQMKNSGDSNEIFIEEAPFTKTDVRTLSNQFFQRNTNVSSMNLEIKPKENKIFKHPIGQTLSNISDHLATKLQKNNNSVESSKCNCIKDTNDENKSNYAYENKHERNEHYVSERLTYSKVRNKKSVYSNKKMSKVKTKGAQKYQYVQSKVPLNFASSIEKKRRNSTKSWKDFNKQKLQLQYIQSGDCSSLSNTSSNKSDKGRATSEPTNFSPINNEFQNTTENYTEKNNVTEKKCINKLDNKHDTYSNVEEILKSISFYPTPEAKISSNVVEKVLTSHSRTCHHTLQNNFYSFSKNNNLCKKYSLTDELVSPDIIKSMNQSNENFVNISNKIKPDAIQSKSQTSMSIGQFNFKHFNPSFQNDKKSSVRKQIQQWENTTAKEKHKSISKYVNKLLVLPELVDIKGKLEFWEKAYNHQTEDKIGKDLPRNSKSASKGTDTKECCSSGTNFKENFETEVHISKDSEIKEVPKPIGAENTISLEKNIGGKLLFETNPDKTRKRSFSDPCVLEPPDKEINDNLQLPENSNEFINPPSSKDEMSSSNDGNFIELSADDEESSTELFGSTEDEYIDDEISENVPTYWGDLSLTKCLTFSNASEYEEFLQLVNSEYFKEQSQHFEFAAAECKSFGIATYFGHVAEKNRFWVLTKGAGRGNLSASVQGFGQHDVAYVGVEYNQKDIYEVTYQVLTPGLYLISVRWMDSPIPGSPFLCKVTF